MIFGREIGFEMDRTGKGRVCGALLATGTMNIKLMMIDHKDSCYQVIRSISRCSLTKDVDHLLYIHRRKFFAKCIVYVVQWPGNSSENIDDPIRI